MVAGSSPARGVFQDSDQATNSTPGGVSYLRNPPPRSPPTPPPARRSPAGACGLTLARGGANKRKEPQRGEQRSWRSCDWSDARHVEGFGVRMRKGDDRCEDLWHQKYCRDPGLNRGPSDLQSDALPTELSRRQQIPEQILPSNGATSLELWFLVLR